MFAFEGGNTSITIFDVEFKCKMLFCLTQDIDQRDRLTHGKLNIQKLCVKHTHLMNYILLDWESIKLTRKNNIYKKFGYP